VERCLACEADFSRRHILIQCCNGQRGYTCGCNPFPTGVGHPFGLASEAALQGLPLLLAMVLLVICFRLGIHFFENAFAKAALDL